MNYHNRSMRRRRNSDKWEVVFSHTDPLSGETVTSYHTVTSKTKNGTIQARDELRFKLENEGLGAGSSITVREYMKEYLEFRENEGRIEPSTLRGYNLDVNTINKYLGNIKLCDLTVNDLTKWMEKMTKEGYSPRSCAKPLGILSQGLKRAMGLDLISKNPCEFVKPPRKQHTEINALSKDDRLRMLTLARGKQFTNLGIAIELGLVTGMRLGEVAGLRWSDIDERGILHVRRSIGSGNGGCYVKVPKTKSSLREIPLRKETFEYLMAYKDMLIKKAASLKVPFDDPYVCAARGLGNRYVNPSTLSKEFTVFAKMNGFNCKFLDLRHTFATFMIASGVDVSTVASYMGHSSVTMTLNVYATVDPVAKRAAVGKIEDAFNEDAPDHICEAGSYPAAADDTFKRLLSSLSSNELRALLHAATEREKGA